MKQLYSLYRYEARDIAAASSLSRMSSSTSSSSTAASLLPLVSNVRVSSVLHNAVAEYGKRHLLDGSSDTCWNSEQGTPQFVVVAFSCPVNLRSVSITFQGGFVGQVDNSQSTRCPLSFALPPRQQLCSQCTALSPRCSTCCRFSSAARAERCPLWQQSAVRPVRCL